MNTEDNTDIFKAHHPLLFGIAWRMLGNVADSEDILQEAQIRWQRQQVSEIRAPRAFLLTMVTRLCLNHLDLARIKNELPTGLDLTFANFPSTDNSPAEDADLADALDSAFSIVLQCLSPVERAVFLLREIFDRDYSEVSRIVEKSEDNCRQILRRARERIAGREPRYKVTLREQQLAVEEFLTATTTGDIDRLTQILTEEVSLVRDGDNLGVPAPAPIRGVQEVCRFLTATADVMLQGDRHIRFGMKNIPYILIYSEGLLTAAMAVLLTSRRVRTVYQITCPVRLRSLGAQFSTAADRSGN